MTLSEKELMELKSKRAEIEAELSDAEKEYDECFKNLLAHQVESANRINECLTIEEMYRIADDAESQKEYEELKSAVENAKQRKSELENQIKDIDAEILDVVLNY